MCKNIQREMNMKMEKLHKMELHNLVGKPERDHYEDLDIDREIILKWNLQKYIVKMRI
jgi:hypothetical protein